MSATSESVSIAVYAGRDWPAKYPYQVATAATMREARQVAASLLGRRTLRGMATWERAQGGTVYQIGRRGEGGGDFVVIEEAAGG